MFTWLVVIVALVFLQRTRMRVSELEEKQKELRAALDRLSQRFARSSEDAPAVAAVRLPEPTSARTPVVAPPRSFRLYEPPTIAARTTEPAIPESERELDFFELSALASAGEKENAEESLVQADVSADESVAEGMRPTAPPPPAPPIRPPSTPTAEPPRPSFDWEGLIGVKLFSWVAGFALALAGVFFLRYSIDHGWLQPPVRMAIGILVGIGLLVGCELKVARNYSQTANALDAAGIAILFSTFFAAHALWHLIPQFLALALLIVVTAVAVLLSIRRESMFIALLGLVGGFATPALLASGQDNPVGLFGYLLLLNAGLAWVAYKKGWPVLTALSLVLTTLYQWGWVSKFLTAGKLPIAVAVFLIFPIASFVSLALGRRTRDDSADRWSPIFSNAARAGAVMPLLFSLYLATVPAYGARYGLLFSFLLAIDVGLFAIAALQGPRLLHLVGAISTVTIFAIWLNGSYDASAWPGVLGFVAAFVLFYLAAPLSLQLGVVRRRAGEIVFDSLAARAVFAAPLLLFAFPALAALEPRTASPALLFGVLFVLLAACASFAIVRGEGAVHFVAAFFVLAAEAVWSARYLTPERLLPALALYAIFGLFYVGAPVAARRWGKPLQPNGAGGLLTLASIALLFFLAAGPVAQAALWGIAILIALLNVGLYLEASSGRLPVLSIAGAALSWIVLAVWWFAATVTAMIVPALLVVAGFALLTIGGHAWAARRSGTADSAGFDTGVYLGLVGHLFLTFVATQPALSVPPLPMLGVLLVLDLAAATAALYLRRGELHLGAVVATAMVLVVWETSVPAAPWPSVAIAFAALVVGLAGVWTLLARRVGAPALLFDGAASGAALLAQIVASVAGTLSGAPGLAVLLGAQLAFLVATLGFAAMNLELLGWMSVAAIIPAAAAGFAWIAAHGAPNSWTTQLVFTAPIYLAFIAYPLVLGKRAGNARMPYLATVLASVVFFFQARTSLQAGGLGGIIGVLPVVEAALLALVLIQLLRLERARGRPRTPEELTRLALVAGAALAFVTVAIPLQLERNWITIGWALEGAALAWLYTRIPHRGLLLASTALLAVVFVRLAANPEVLNYEPRGAIRIWNWYLYTYLLCAGAMLFAGRLLGKTDDRLHASMPRLSKLLPAAGTILLFLLLNIEIADYFATGPTITFNFTAGLAQDLTYTLGWALFAVALLAAGIVTHQRPTRIASIGLIAVATLKCFLHDFGRLGGLYRVGSFVGLAICLSLVAVALQKFVLATPGAPPRPSEAQT